jgi:hypothetical protein
MCELHRYEAQSDSQVSACQLPVITGTDPIVSPLPYNIIGPLAHPALAHLNLMHIQVWGPLGYGEENLESKLKPTKY